MKLDVTGGGINSGDGDPQEELLGLNPGHIGDRPITEMTLDLLVVVHKVIKLNVAGVIHMDLEFSILRQRVLLDGGGDQAPGEAEMGEEVVDVLGRGDGEVGFEEEGQREEEERDCGHG